MFWKIGVIFVLIIGKVIRLFRSAEILNDHFIARNLMNAIY